MVDPSLNVAVTSTLEKFITHTLRFDPATLAQISHVIGVLKIQCVRPRFTVYCFGSKQGIKLTCYCEDDAETTLKGSATALLGLLKQPKTLANSGVELSGSVGLLQQWQKILKQVDIDWEEAISLVMGDIAGPLFADSLRKSASWAKTQSEAQQRLLKEYLTEELSLFPSKLEAQHLFDQIHELDLSTDRLAAKVDYLKQQLQSLTNRGENKPS